MARINYVVMLVCVLAAVPAQAKSLIATGGACAGVLRENATLSLTVPGGMAKSPQEMVAQLDVKLKEVQELTKGIEKLVINNQNYTINAQPQQMTYSGQASVSFNIGSAKAAWELAEILEAKQYKVNLNVNGHADGNCFGSVPIEDSEGDV